MYSRGIASGAALWLLLLLSSLALAALAMSRVTSQRSASRLTEARLLYVMNAVYVMAQVDGFSRDAWTQKIDGGEVRVQRRSIDGERMFLSCEIEMGGEKHVVDVVSRKKGGQWHVVHWRERS